MLVINSILDEEKKDIAILKAVGFSNRNILKIIFFRVSAITTISYIMGIILELVMQNIEKNLMQKIFETNIAINYNLKNLIFIFCGIILICVISSLINIEKIKKINAITLLKEE